MGKVFLQVSEFDLEKVLASVREGEEVVLMEGTQEVTVVRPIAGPPAGERRGTFGDLRGMVKSDDRLLDPLPEGELRRWEGD